MRHTLLNTTILFLSLFVLLTSDSLGQSIKDTKRILGKWKFTETERKNRTNNVLIKIDGDSIVVMIEDDYGNYDPTSSKNLRFPVVPKQSGPKGMSFEKNYITIDSDNDTIDVTQYIQFKNMNRKKVDVSVGGLYLVKLVGSTTESYQRTLEKSKMWLDNSRNTDLIGVRRK